MENNHKIMHNLSISEVKTGECREKHQKIKKMRKINGEMTLKMT
jgi:hypothetical protein